MKFIQLIPLIVLAGQSTEANESGAEHLTKVFKQNEAAIRELRENKIRLDDPRHAELRAQLDAAAHQRDAFASGLHWHTDLAAAQAEAKRTQKPILSLRLLGRLDEEYSCANSRFFRTVLYANAEVATLLREKFVLHWKSVRPAPLLTIDMGDGRRIKRTITGNSIHYVLNAQGQVIDALPGIYSPAAFQLALARATQQVRRQRQNSAPGMAGRRISCAWSGSMPPCVQVLMGTKHRMKSLAAPPPSKHCGDTRELLFPAGTQIRTSDSPFHLRIAGCVSKPPRMWMSSHCWGTFPVCKNCSNRGRWPRHFSCPPNLIRPKP